MKTLILTGILIFFFSYVNVMAQVQNDSCTTASPIPFQLNEMEFTCIQGQLTGASPDDVMSRCSYNAAPTVWYKVTGPGYYTPVNVYISSPDIERLVVSVYTGDCGDLDAYINDTVAVLCETGVRNEVLLPLMRFHENREYFIAVSCLGCEEGQFEICLNAVPDQLCQHYSAHLEPVWREEEGPLEGPYHPGEWVDFCLTIDAYKVNESRAYLAGIIPYFGEGWDRMYMNSGGEPAFTTLNGDDERFGYEGFMPDVTWNWWSGEFPVFYSGISDHLWYSIDSSKMKGSICNSLYRPHCTGRNLSGDCEYDEDKYLDYMQGIWLTHNINVPWCPEINSYVFYGDGYNFQPGSVIGPWKWCFSLRVKEVDQCQTGPKELDLTVGGHIILDSQIGRYCCWWDYTSYGMEPSQEFSAEGCCQEVRKEEFEVGHVCHLDTLSIHLTDTSVTYWKYHFYYLNDDFDVSGKRSEGFVTNDDVMKLPIVHWSNETDFALLDIEGFDENGCLQVIRRSDIFSVEKRDFAYDNTYLRDFCKGDEVVIPLNWHNNVIWNYQYTTTPPVLSGSGRLMNGDTFRLQLPDTLTQQIRFSLYTDGLSQLSCHARSEDYFIDVLPEKKVRADFDYSIPNDQSPTRVRITNLSQEGHYYRLDYGDGEIQEGANLPLYHVYPSLGDYIVTLESFGACGSDTLTKVIELQGAPPNLAFAGAPRAGKAPMVVHFKGTTFPDEPGTIWNWEFEGGIPATSSEQNPAVTYKRAGYFPVRLTVTYSGEDYVKQHFNYISVQRSDSETEEMPTPDTLTGNSLWEGTPTIANRNAKEEGAFKFFPNPATDQLNILADNNEGIHRVILQTVLGRPVPISVQYHQPHHCQLNWQKGNVTGGVYLITIESSSGRTTHRVVIQ